MFCLLGNTLGLEGNIERVDFQYITFKNDILNNTAKGGRGGGGVMKMLTKGEGKVCHVLTFTVVGRRVVSQRLKFNFDITNIIYEQSLRDSPRGISDPM